MILLGTRNASEHVIKNATNIDERVWAYTVSESSNVYSLKEVNDKYLPAKVDDAFVADPDAEIKNGKAYVSQGDNEFIVDKQTIFVDTMNNVAYQSAMTRCPTWRRPSWLMSWTAAWLRSSSSWMRDL